MQKGNHSVCSIIRAVWETRAPIDTAMQILGAVHDGCSEAAELLSSGYLDASPADIKARPRAKATAWRPDEDPELIEDAK